MSERKPEKISRSKKETITFTSDDFEKFRQEFIAKHGAESAQMLRTLEDKKIQKQTAVSRRQMLGALGGLGILTIGGAYAANSAVKATEDAAETRLNQEKQKFIEWQKKFADTAFKLMDQMFLLMNAMGNLKRMEDAASAAISGIVEDAIDYITRGDKSPDKLKNSLKRMAEKDPELAKVIKDIEKSSDDLKDLVKEFSSMVNDTTDYQTQRDRFMDEFFFHFKQRLLMQTPAH